MSVSMRISATIPFVSAGDRRIWIGAESGGERHHRIGVLIVQVRVESAPDDLGHGHPLGVGERVDTLALLIGEVYLGASR